MYNGKIEFLSKAFDIQPAFSRHDRSSVFDFKHNSRQGWNGGRRPSLDRFPIVVRPATVGAHGAALNLGRVLAHKGNLEGARQQVRSVLATVPDHADARRLLTELETRL